MLPTLILLLIVFRVLLGIPWIIWILTLFRLLILLAVLVLLLTLLVVGHGTPYIQIDAEQYGNITILESASG